MFCQAFDHLQAIPEESEATVGELVMIPIIREILLDAFLSIEPLESDHHDMGITYGADKINDLRVTGYEFDSGERDSIGGYIIEPLDELFIEIDIGVKGDDCFIGMIVEFEEFWCFDIGVHEEHGIGVKFGEIVELFEFSFGAVEVIVHCYPYDTFMHRHSFEEVYMISNGGIRHIIYSLCRDFYHELL